MLTTLLIGMLINNENIYDTHISNASRKYGVDAGLIKAVIKQESNFNPTAFRSEPHIQDASWGLMQVLLNTAKNTTKNKTLTARELLKPEVNIDIGTRYIAHQLKRYNNNIKHALAAYNAGSVKYKNGKYINQHYVDSTYKHYLRYKGKIRIHKAFNMFFIFPFAAMTFIGLKLFKR